MEAILSWFDSVTSFFQTILDFISSIFQLVKMLIDGVLWLIGTLPGLVTQVTALFAYCPPFIGIFLTASLSIIVLYAVIKML